jgi:outer membrane protein assembly factor BamB
VLYAGDGGGNFYAVNISDGQKIWNFTTGHIEGSPVISNGAVYFGSNIVSSSKIFALNASIGIEVWNCTIGLPWGFVTPRTYLSSVVEGYGAVYVIDGGSDPALYAINKSSGDLLWTTPIGENVFAPSTSPCVGEGKVFVGCAINYGTDHPEATLLAFDAANGNLIWNKTGPVGGGFSTPLLANGRIYVSGGGTLQAVNSIDGALLWNVSGTSYSDPYIADGKLYAISGNNILSYQPKCNVLILDAFSGKTIMNYQIDGDFKSESAPVFANGAVYFGNLTHVLALGGSLVSTPTPSPSSPPTPTPTASQNPSPISTPTPTIPELPIWAVPMLLIIVMLAAALSVYFKKHREPK